MTTRTRPDAREPFLRHQVGEMVPRPETEPVYTGRTITGTKRTGRIEYVFKLWGCGETEAAAMRMAKGKI